MYIEHCIKSTIIIRARLNGTENRSSLSWLYTRYLTNIQSIALPEKGLIIKPSSGRANEINLKNQQIKYNNE